MRFGPPVRFARRPDGHNLAYQVLGRSGNNCPTQGVVAVVRRAGEIGLPTERVLVLLEPIPSGLRCRLRAWALHEVTDAQPEALVTEIAHAIRGRDPTGDDLRLIQRITEELSPSSTSRPGATR